MNPVPQHHIQPWFFKAFPQGDKHGRMAQECIRQRAEILRMLHELKVATKEDPNNGHDKAYRELEGDMRDLDNFARSGLTTTEQMQQMDSSCIMLQLRVSSQLAKIKSGVGKQEDVMPEVAALRIIEEQAVLLECV